MAQEFLWLGSLGQQAFETLQGTKLQGLDGIGFLSHHLGHGSHIISQNQSTDKDLALFFCERIDGSYDVAPLLACF